MGAWGLSTRLCRLPTLQILFVNVYFYSLLAVLGLCCSRAALCRAWLQSISPLVEVQFFALGPVVSSRTRDWTCISCISGQIPYHREILFFFFFFERGVWLLSWVLESLLEGWGEMVGPCSICRLSVNCPLLLLCALQTAARASCASVVSCTHPDPDFFFPGVTELMNAEPELKPSLEFQSRGPWTHNSILATVWLGSIRKEERNFPGGPAAKTPSSPRGGPGFHPWLGN